MSEYPGKTLAGRTRREHPVVARLRQNRTYDLHLRLADQITRLPDQWRSSTSTWSCSRGG